MGLPAKKASTFTYGDYVTWDDNERWEIIAGEAFNMTPAPNRKHQAISAQLMIQIGKQLENRECQVFHAPFDVRLPLDSKKEEDIENVVQPDISVICDNNKLDEKGCLGAPDLIIEILSPSTSRKDRMEKFFLYERAGVREYWLVSPDDKMVEIFILGKDGKYGRPWIYSDIHNVELKAIKNLKIDLQTLFKAAGI